MYMPHINDFTTNINGSIQPVINNYCCNGYFNDTRSFLPLYWSTLNQCIIENDNICEFASVTNDNSGIQLINGIYSLNVSFNYNSTITNLPFNSAENFFLITTSQLTSSTTLGNALVNDISNNFYYDNVSGGVLNNLTLPYRRNEYWDLSIYNQSINSDNNYFTYSCKFRITDQNKNKIYLAFYAPYMNTTSTNTKINPCYFVLQLLHKD